MTTLEKMWKIWAGPGDENPSPEGPEGEHVGEDEGDASERSDRDLKQIPGPGAPMTPDHQNIDSNPIDPRVF